MSGVGRRVEGVGGCVTRVGCGHLSVMQLDLRAAQLFAQLDGSGLSLTQCPRHILEFSLWERGTFLQRFPASQPHRLCHLWSL